MEARTQVQDAAPWYLPRRVSHVAMEACMSDATWKKFVRVCMVTLYIVGKGMEHEYGTQTGNQSR